MGSKRNELVIMEDRMRVCELMAKGYTSPTEIAAKLNESRSVSEHVTVGMVKSDIKYMENKFLERGLEHYEVYRNRIESSINLLKRTFWEGYELSTKKKITIESQEVMDEETFEERALYGYDEGDKEGVLRNAKVKEEMRTEGNVAFLNGVLACEDRLMKLYGMEVSRIALTDTTGQKDISNPLEDVKRLLEEQQSRLLPSYDVEGTIEDDSTTNGERIVDAD